MSEDGQMDRYNTDGQDAASCCGNCLFFCEHEGEGYVHCIESQRETPNPDDAPCDRWTHEDEHQDQVQFKIEMSPRGMTISMRVGRERQRSLLELALLILGMVFLLLEFVAVVVNRMVEGDQSGFVLFFASLSMFCIGMGFILGRRRRKNERRKIESRQGFEPDEGTLRASGLGSDARNS